MAVGSLVQLARLQREQNQLTRRLLERAPVAEDVTVTRVMSAVDG